MVKHGRSRTHGRGPLFAMGVRRVVRGPSRFVFARLGTRAASVCRHEGTLVWPEAKHSAGGNAVIFPEASGMEKLSGGTPRWKATLRVGLRLRSLSTTRTDRTD